MPQGKLKFALQIKKAFISKKKKILLLKKLFPLLFSNCKRQSLVFPWPEAFLQAMRCLKLLFFFLSTK